MNKKNETSREQARQILKSGILDMSIARLIQMSELGLKGSVVLSNEIVSVENVFNCISYDDESDVITFSIEETQKGCYGSISFSVSAIEEISGCEDKENPEEYLNIRIKLRNATRIDMRILY